jgi:hypothetical protein
LLLSILGQSDVLVCESVCVSGVYFCACFVPLSVSVSFSLVYTD